jgi:hypothetical protein
MSDTTMTEAIEATPDLDIPFEPVRLVEMWEQAAADLLGQGEAVAAGAFLGCARMLKAWIRHEGAHAIMCMPTSMVLLIGAAMQFDQTNKEHWKRLAGLAKACQGAGTS